MTMSAKSARVTTIKKHPKGGSYCCMIGCHCASIKSFGVSFSLLPRAGISKEQDKWRAALIHAIGRSDKSFNPLRAKICTRHFEEECIKKGPTGKFLGLVPGSMPTRWMPEKSFETPQTARPKPLPKTEGNDDINLQPFSKPTKTKHPSPVKNKGPIKRTSDTDTASPKIVLKMIKMEDHPDIGNIGMTSSTPREQYLDASCINKVAALDQLPYNIACPVVSSASDEEECPALGTQLEGCDATEEAVTKRLSPHHIPHQRTVTTKNPRIHEIALLTPKCKPQRTKTLKNVKSSYARCQNIESQNEDINLINPAFIKKEPKDFETLWNAETMTQIGNHSSENKTGTEITMPGSEESSSVNNLTHFIKKEPEDLNSSWNIVQTDGFENKMETNVYPTGIYCNVHFAHLKRGNRQ